MPRAEHVKDGILGLLAGKFSGGANAETLANELGVHHVWAQALLRQLLRSYSIIRYQKFTPGEEHLGRWRYIYLINDQEHQRIQRKRQLAFMDKVRENERTSAMRRHARQKEKRKKRTALKQSVLYTTEKNIWDALLYYQDVGVTVETLVDVLNLQRSTIRYQINKLIDVGKVYSRKERRLSSNGRKWLIPVYYPTKAAAANQLGEIDALAIAVKDAIRFRACHSLSEIAKDAGASRDDVRAKLDELIDREVVTFQQIVVNRTADGRAIIENRYYLVKE